jgi:hypothetical protein
MSIAPVQPYERSAKTPPRAAQGPPWSSLSHRLLTVEKERLDANCSCVYSSLAAHCIKYGSSAEDVNKKWNKRLQSDIYRCIPACLDIPSSPRLVGGAEKGASERNTTRTNLAETSEPLFTLRGVAVPCRPRTDAANQRQEADSEPNDRRGAGSLTGLSQRMESRQLADRPQEFLTKRRPRPRVPPQTSRASGDSSSWWGLRVFLNLSVNPVQTSLMPRLVM